MPRIADEDADASSRPILMIYSGLCAVALAWFATGVFGVDSYNHIARLTIECARPGDPLLDMWQVQLALIPNLALDLINLPLCGIVPAEQLLALIATGAMLTIFVSAWVLQKLIVGRTEWTVVLVPALSLNLVTFMGYTNYLVGMAGLLLFAIYLFRRPFAERNFGGLFLVSNVAGVLLCLCHAFAAMVGGMLLFLWMLDKTSLRDVRSVFRRGLRAAACYVVPVAFIVFTDKGSTEIVYSLQSKLGSLFSALSFGPVLLTAVLTFLWVAAGYAGFREKALRLAPGMGRILLGLLILLLLLPTSIGAAVDIDSRMAVPLVYLLVVSLQLVRCGPRIRTAIVALSVTTLAAHLAYAIPARSKLHQEVNEIRAAAATLPPYATLFSIRDGQGADRLHWHMASVATLAGRVFNPLEFSGKGMQPLDAKPGFACRNVEVGRPLTLEESIKVRDDAYIVRKLSAQQLKDFAYARRWTRDYSHVLFLHRNAADKPPVERLRPVAQGSVFTIYANPAVAVSGPEGPCR